MTLPNQPRFIDLFAGCGGISVGLCNAGWRGLFAIERSPMAFATLKRNLIDKRNCFDWPSWLPVSEHDITGILRNHGSSLKKLEGKVDLVAGGPPCQGFSLAGRRNENDERNKLVHSYIEFVSLVKPQMLFLENVKGFTIGFKKKKGRGEPYSSYVSRMLHNLGYKLKDDIIDFSNFGVPQRRNRYILIGLRNGEPETFFHEIIKVRSGFLGKKGLNKKTVLWEAISDLERKHGEIQSAEFKTFKEGVYGKFESSYQRLMRRKWKEKRPNSHRFANHRKKTVERSEFILLHCSRNKDIGENTKRKFNLKKKSIIPLNRGSQCPTLTTLPDDYIHYSEPRILTVREYARVQSFDDSFEFVDKYTTGGNRRREEVPRYSQVGNAVAPLFVELSGEVLKAMI